MRPATSGRTSTDSLLRRVPTAFTRRSARSTATAAASTGMAKPAGGPPEAARFWAGSMTFCQ